MLVFDAKVWHRLVFRETRPYVEELFFCSSVPLGSYFCTRLYLARNFSIVTRRQPTSSSSCGHFRQLNLPYFIVFFPLFNVRCKLFWWWLCIVYISAKLHCYNLSFGITCNSYTYVHVRKLGIIYTTYKYVVHMMPNLGIIWRFLASFTLKLLVRLM